MKYNLLISLILFSFSSYSQNAITIGKTITIHSEILKEDRILEIHLPKNYEESDKTYPVLYLLDSYYNFSHAVGSVEYLQLNRLIPDMIVVGIRNTNRNRDLSPDSPELSTDERERMGTTGEAHNFIAFLEKELIPHVQKTYKAAPYRVIVGHSRGGLFNVYTFFKKPELFDAYLTISPSLWYPNELISQEFENVFKKPSELSATFYMTLANENKGNMRGNVLKLSGEFNNYINAHKEADLRFKYEPMPEESHGTIGLPSIFSGLRFIFEPTQYEIPRTREEIMAQGGPDAAIEKAVTYFDELSEKYGFKVTNEYALVDLGYAFMRLEELQEYSVNAFKANVQAHPDSYDAYSNLGMAYEELDKLQKAKSNYEKALRLVMETEDPEWEFYKADLENLEKKIEAKAGN
ncbi:alpha/beta hydrolase-fold protein [Gillisia limnaea]|uniref:Tetratricopeptide TPR_2 repeat-containing protein n=1 Tax=Gillisia limnaea (strain DSM 15749 / LMG 21470 / R-8282) TaxID=865937 RepID=H2BXF3_GILLR|nr:alpha/beta hydrolase-fold protein [Gillisia limnaea]EHQ02035.1 Tetratricopeptide TPR_2 repeat-containing protein [Gillisia limnaea DSM 15749]